MTVSVYSDTTYEPNETFYVNLSSPVGAVIADGQGVVTILNDDPVPPTLAVSDPTVTEGNSGITPITFTVSLSFASAQTVTVNYHDPRGQRGRRHRLHRDDRDAHLRPRRDDEDRHRQRSRRHRGGE